MHDARVLVVDDSAAMRALFCDILEPGTLQPYNRCPRGIAKKAEAYLKASGIGDTIYVGPEADVARHVQRVGRGVRDVADAHRVDDLRADVAGGQSGLRRDPARALRQVEVLRPGEAAARLAYCGNSTEKVVGS